MCKNIVTTGESIWLSPPHKTPPTLFNMRPFYLLNNFTIEHANHLSVYTFKYSSLTLAYEVFNYAMHFWRICSK